MIAAPRFLRGSPDPTTSPAPRSTGAFGYALLASESGGIAARASGLSCPKRRPIFASRRRPSRRPTGLRHALRYGTLAGIALATAGYGVFTVQDAIIKWLVADHTVWQILFLRSVTVTLISALIARRHGFRAVLKSPNRLSPLANTARSSGPSCSAT